MSFCQNCGKEKVTSTGGEFCPDCTFTTSIRTYTGTDTSGAYSNGVKIEYLKEDAPPPEEISSFENELIDMAEDHNFLTLTSKAKVITSSSEWGSEFLAQEAEKLGLEKQPDLLYIEHKLVHANVNKNKDEFKLEELKLAEKTPVLKLVNWEHSEENMGTIFASKLIDSPEDDDESPYLLVGVAISKAKFPEKTKEIIERHQKNELYFSMETYFKSAECSTCSQTFAGGASTYCEHLQSRLSIGSSTSRILRGLTFAGDAVVKNPADVDAESLAIAKSKNDNEEIQPTLIKEEVIVAEKTWTKEELDLEVEKKVQEALDKISVSELNEKIESLETEKASLTEKVEELVKLLDEATLSIDEKEKALSSLSEEFDGFKTSVANKELVRSRVRELAKIGYSVPDEEDAEKYETFASKLLGMDDNAFALMKELVAETISNGTEESKEEESKGSVESKEEDEDDLPTGVAHAEEVSFEDRVKQILGGVLAPTKN